jgi:hypothetical protein
MLDPGESAILVVVDRPWVAGVERELTGYDHLVRSRLGPLSSIPADVDQAASEDVQP